MQLIYYSLNLTSGPGPRVWPQSNYVLLTGDGELRKVALTEGVEVHGTIYIIAEMVEHHILTELQGAMKLECLLNSNPRLPKSIINRLIEKWRGSL